MSFVKTLILGRENGVRAGLRKSCLERRLKTLLRRPLFRLRDEPIPSQRKPHWVCSRNHRGM